MKTISLLQNYLGQQSEKQDPFSLHHVASHCHFNESFALEEFVGILYQRGLRFQ